MNWQVSLALRGELQDYLDGVTVGAMKGIREGVEIAADEGLRRLRRDLREGLPNLSEKTWRSVIYPKSRSTLTYSPAAILYSKADAIVAAFDKGGEFTADGKFMAVPLPFYKDQLPRRRNGSSKSKIELTYEKFGAENLEVIPANEDRPAMLVLKTGGISRTGRISARKRTKTGKLRKGTGMIPLFSLIDHFTLEKRLNVQDIFDDIERRFPQHIRQGLSIHLADYTE